MRDKLLVIKQQNETVLPVALLERGRSSVVGDDELDFRVVGFELSRLR